MSDQAKETKSYDVEEARVRISVICGKAIYFVVALILLGISIGIIGYAVVEIWKAFRDGTGIIAPLLDGVALSVLGLAVIDVSKYLLDEEVFRNRELGAASEARATLTKFFTIITIAISLEAIVLIFGSIKDNDIPRLVYPVYLLLTAVVITLGLGLFQWLNAKAAQLTEKGG
ncbi:MAG: hypothetical protein RIG67_24455 [Rhodospirillales bacterium]